MEKYSGVILNNARIGCLKRNTIIKFYRLIQSCSDNGLNICGLQIGAVEDNYLLEEIRAMNPDNLIIENDPELTYQSRELIDIADIIVGVGRSYMEASLKNKIMLCPIKGQEIPCLVKQDNFEILFSYNFSDRGILPNNDLIPNHEYVMAILKNRNLQKK